MTHLIHQFQSGEAIVMPLSDLERFRDDIKKLPELYQYRLEYSENEVKITLIQK